MGLSQQRKGADGEKELTDILRNNGFPVCRGGSQTYGTVPDIIGLPGIHVEVKRQEKLSLSDWLSQAKRDSIKFQDGLPAVFHRRNRQSWIVSMDLESWLKLYERRKCNE